MQRSVGNVSGGNGRVILFGRHLILRSAVVMRDRVPALKFRLGDDM